MEAVVRIDAGKKTVILDGVIFPFTREQYDNLVDMLRYCADVAPGVMVQRDLCDYKKIKRLK
jgi:hypothetical protein